VQQPCAQAARLAAARSKFAMVLIVVSSSQFMPVDFIQFHSRNPISQPHSNFTAAIRFQQHNQRTSPNNCCPSRHAIYDEMQKKTMILHLFLFAHNQGGCLMETTRDLSTEPETLQAIPCETGFVCWRPWFVPA
jgi:hypothetical protein